jgi:hypothetical protein
MSSKPVVFDADAIKIIKHVRDKAAEVYKAIDIQCRKARELSKKNPEGAVSFEDLKEEGAAIEQAEREYAETALPVWMFMNNLLDMAGGENETS